MNTGMRPQQELDGQRSGQHHSRLIVCGAGSCTDASKSGVPAPAFEIDLEHVSSLFPSECDEPVASGGQLGIAGTRRVDRRPAENSILTIVPAGRPAIYPDSATRHPSRASTTRSRQSLAALARSRATSAVHALRCAGRLTLSIARTIATRTWSLASEIAVAIAAAIVPRVIRIAIALRSAEPAAIAAGHTIRSAVGSLPGTGVSIVRLGVRVTLQSALTITRASARHAADATRRARLAMTSVRAYTLHIRYRDGRLLHDPKRTSAKRAGSVRSRLRAPLAASVPAILVAIAAVAIGTFEPRPEDLLAASPLVDRSTIVGLRAPLQPFTPVGGPRTGLTDAIARGPETITNQTPTPARRETTAAIQRVLNRYRDAFSTLDHRAVQSVWPSVDVRGLRTDFDRLYEQNLDYESCDITVGAADARAVCRGIVRSMPSSTRINRRESRRWRFVLRKANDRWLIDAVDVS